ncbi:MAG: phage shock protein PspC [Firmicutes bacterium]|nr:phage shock protein PspC [Bacillota bacterium]
MWWLLRLAAYGISSLAVWEYFQGTTERYFFGGEPLTLDVEHEMLLGVCAGLSNYTGIDVTILRLVWIIASFYRGVGVLIYILAFLVMPLKG